LSLKPDLQKLLAENAKLRQEIAELRQQLRFFDTHPTLALGMAGESLIAGISGGLETKHTAISDIILPDGATIEVKTAHLSSPSLTAPTKRWQWNKIFGQTGLKSYDYLVLVGEIDERYRYTYSYSDHNYVFFLLPYIEVYRLSIKGSPLAIVLNSNPKTARGRSCELFAKFQASPDQLEQRFKVASALFPQNL